MLSDFKSKNLSLVSLGQSWNYKIRTHIQLKWCNGLVCSHYTSMEISFTIKKKELTKSPRRKARKLPEVCSFSILSILILIWMIEFRSVIVRVISSVWEFYFDKWEFECRPMHTNMTTKSIWTSVVNASGSFVTVHSKEIWGTPVFKFIGMLNGFIGLSNVSLFLLFGVLWDFSLIFRMSYVYQLTRHNIQST